jgi:hypothetical protein
LLIERVPSNHQSGVHHAPTILLDSQGAQLFWLRSRDRERGKSEGRLPVLDALVSWAWANPLPSVGIMAGIGVLAGAFAFIPELNELLHRDHPRC